MRPTLLAIICAATVYSQGFLHPDPQLMAEIAKIKAIDNHAHPVRAVSAGEKDVEFDALPVDVMEPYTEPVRTRPESGEAARARRALFGDLRPGRKTAAMEKHADAYPVWVLDRLGIDVMLANRVATAESRTSMRMALRIGRMGR